MKPTTKQRRAIELCGQFEQCLRGQPEADVLPALSQLSAELIWTVQTTVPSFQLVNEVFNGNEFLEIFVSVLQRYAEEAECNAPLGQREDEPWSEQEMSEGLGERLEPQEQRQIDDLTTHLDQCCLNVEDCDVEVITAALTQTTVRMFFILFPRSPSQRADTLEIVTRKVRSLVEAKNRKWRRQ